MYNKKIKHIHISALKSIVNFRDIAMMLDYNHKFVEIENKRYPLNNVFKTLCSLDVSGKCNNVQGNCCYIKYTSLLGYTCLLTGVFCCCLNLSFSEIKMIKTLSHAVIQEIING